MVEGVLVLKQMEWWSTNIACLPADRVAAGINLGECLENWKRCAVSSPTGLGDKRQDIRWCEASLAQSLQEIHGALVSEKRFHAVFRSAAQFRPSEGSRWGWFPIIRQSAVTVGLLAVYRYFSIHPHDHPGMFGVQKVLQGKVRIKQYETDSSESRDVRLVGLKLAGDSILQRNALSSFTPYKRNLHDIQSLTPNSIILSLKLASDDIDIQSFYYEVPFAGSRGEYNLFSKMNRRVIVSGHQPRC